MSLFLKEPWIQRTIHSQLHVHREGNGAQPLAHAQLIEVMRQRGDRSFEICVSDSKHFIVGILTNETVEDFQKEIDCKVGDIRGCYIVVDRFHYDYSHELKKFIILIEKFTYCGGESDMYGDPLDINTSYILRNLASSPLYEPFSPDDLFIHRCNVGFIHKGGSVEEVEMLLHRSQLLCREQCQVCASRASPRDDGPRGAGDVAVRTRRYHPIMERVVESSQQAQGSSGEREGVRRIYISEDMYIEKTDGGSSRRAPEETGEESPGEDKKTRSEDAALLCYDPREMDRTDFIPDSTSGQDTDGGCFLDMCADSEDE